MEEGVPGIQGRPRISCEEEPTALPSHACSPCLKHQSTHHASSIPMYKLMTTNNQNYKSEKIWESSWFELAEIDRHVSATAQLEIDCYHVTPVEINHNFAKAA